MSEMTSQKLVERLGKAERELQRCQQSARVEFQEKLDARDAAQSAVLARMTAGWQPIATAPRDGTSVLLWAEGWEWSWGIQRGSYSYDKWHCEEGSVKDNDPDFDPETEIDPDEQAEEDQDVENDSNLGPTHWHALPATPASP